MFTVSLSLTKLNFIFSLSTFKLYPDNYRVTCINSCFFLWFSFDLIFSKFSEDKAGNFVRKEFDLIFVPRKSLLCEKKLKVKSIPVFLNLWYYECMNFKTCKSTFSLRMDVYIISLIFLTVLYLFYIYTSTDFVLIVYHQIFLCESLKYAALSIFSMRIRLVKNVCLCIWLQFVTI